MALTFKGKLPTFKGDLKIEVPTPTYSGTASSNADDSINPYTSQGPGVGGAGQTASEIAADRSGGGAAINEIFSFTGNSQSYIVPSGITQLLIKMWGAGGGQSQKFEDTVGWFLGGAGSYITGIINVTAGETLTIFVGGGGGHAVDLTAGAGGFNGGASGGNGTPGWFGAGGGGGASDIRQGGTTLSDRIAISSGGGGSGVDGGSGGLTVGFKGNDAGNGKGGIGGTQIAGGAGGSNGVSGSSAPSGTLGNGGAGFNGSTSAGGGGGGGGLYGGGGGGNNRNAGGGGGGGSSLIPSGGSGIASNAIDGTANIKIAPNNTDTDYIPNAADGAGPDNVATPVDGGNGLIILLSV